MPFKENEIKPQMYLSIQKEKFRVQNEIKKKVIQPKYVRSVTKAVSQRCNLRKM